MGLLRPAARVLDAWGALLLGVAVVLGVIILLATPGPWREVVGAPPAATPETAPRDVAVFVRGGADGDDCTAAVWLHVEHEQPSLTAVVVPVQTQVAVPGAGFDRLCRVVRLFGPEEAAAALGDALGVPFAGSISLSAEGLGAAVPTMFPSGDSQRERRQRRAALRAWAGRGDATTIARRQTEQLAEALPRVPLESLSVVAVANYALGSELAESDLDLQQATALARSAREVRAHDVAVRALPVVRETRGEGVFWRPRVGAADRLAQALRLGLWPPRTTVAVTSVERTGGVIVALPGGLGAVAAAEFAQGLRAAVAESAGPGIDVTTVRCDAADAAGTLAASVATSRPLAVVLVSATEGVGDDTDGGEARLGATLACAVRLQRLYQPAVLVAPVAGVPDGVEVEAADALDASGLPVVAVRVPGGGGATVAGVGPSSPASPSAADGTATAAAGLRADWREAGRAAAAAAVRACWPAVLAPGIPGTWRGVTFAERRTVELAVLDGDGAEAARTWLAVCGYVPEAVGGDWAPEAGVVRVAHHPGLRRLAVAVAGDLGVPDALVVEDADAPAPVTVVP
ncbi:MAG TPA: hypothetical protein VLA35_05045 [Thermoleophilia bacterium]|nr:hypothetical protein [Thermoleophilia bacterium]